MKHYIWLLLLLCTTPNARAQCTKGDCNNGSGTFDYGWCTYTGSFKDGKADGQGTMAYSDYAYTGSFSNGVEDGQGTITYADGRKETVRYAKGTRIQGPTRVAAQDYKPLEGSDANCLSGDCINGTGTYRFPSGNKYSGQFKDRRRHGEGTAYFANGDEYAGTWRDNEKANGTYTFSNGARYSGSYDARGMELNGTMRIGTMEIPYVNGVAKVPPPPPQASYTSGGGSKRPDAPAYRPCCPDCHCLGKIHETYTGGKTVIESGIRTTAFGGYNKCSRCGGTGHVDPQLK
jgi:hypothetical protein